MSYVTISSICNFKTASQLVLVVKNLPANAGDIRGAGLIPGLGRFPRGHSNPFQLFFPVESMDKGAWRATVHRVNKESDTTEAA